LTTNYTKLKDKDTFTLTRLLTQRNVIKKLSIDKYLTDKDTFTLFVDKINTTKHYKEILMF